jgi:predicted amidohydrolase YtcJ
VTSVGAAVNRGFADDLHAYQQLAENGRLRMRVNEFLSWELLEAASQLRLGSGFGGPLLRAGPIKVFVDGGASVAAVALRSGGGIWRTPPEQLHEIFARAGKMRLQVACHAVGDAAIEAVLDAVEAAPDRRPLRHRIEHCTACPPDLQARAARLGVVAVMQPLFAAFRARAADAFPGDLHPFLAAHRDLLRRRVPLAFSSDLPVTPDPNPWHGMAAAVLTKQQPITVRAALAAYTVGGAYASFEERTKGRLEPGYVADFQIYDSDPIVAGPQAWSEVRPRAVFLGGTEVYRDRSSPPSPTRGEC